MIKEKQAANELLQTYIKIILEESLKKSDYNCEVDKAKIESVV